MSKRDLGSKLKVRLGEWEAYGDQPITPAEPELEHVGREGAASAIPVSPDSTALVPAHMEARENAGHPRSEAQVEELRAALEREREQSRQLLEAVAREQVLHAVSLRSQLKRDGAPVPTADQGMRKFERLPTTYRAPRDGSRHVYLWLSLVALFIAIGCTYVAYALGR